MLPQMIKYRVDHLNGGRTWPGFHSVVYMCSMSKRKCGGLGSWGVFAELVKCNSRCLSKYLERTMLSTFLGNDTEACNSVAADSS